MLRAKGPRAAGSLGMAMDAQLTLWELMSASGRFQNLRSDTVCQGKTGPFLSPLFLTPSLTQPPRKIVLQIPHRLEPDGDAQQTFRDPGARAGFGAYPPVRGRAGMRNRGLGVAQVRRDRDHPRGIDHPPRRLAPAFHDERDYGASRALLAHRERVLRVGREPRVVHALHPRMRLEPQGELERASRLRLHPYPERLYSLQQHPSIERRQSGARGAQEGKYRVHHLAVRAEHRSAQHPALTVEIFRGRMDHKVGAELEGPLQGGRAEAVVDREQRAFFAGDLR